MSGSTDLSIVTIFIAPTTPCHSEIFETSKQGMRAILKFHSLISDFPFFFFFFAFVFVLVFVLKLNRNITMSA